GTARPYGDTSACPTAGAASAATPLGPWPFVGATSVATLLLLNAALAPNHTEHQSVATEVAPTTIQSKSKSVAHGRRKSLVGRVRSCKRRARPVGPCHPAGPTSGTSRRLRAAAILPATE